MSKQLDLGIKGVKARSTKQAIIITSWHPLKVLSSAVLNGGFVYATSIVNYHVQKNFKNSNPAAYLRRAASKLALSGPTVGLMTAARLKNVSIKKNQDEKVATIVTAGASCPAAAGDEIEGGNTHQGTINTILIIDGNLTDSAMVETAKTATEAKSLTLADLDIRSKFSNEVASGTVTDSICVACTGEGKRQNYAGTGTRIGQAIARTAREAVEEAILRENGISRNRPLLSRLNERGIDIWALVETGMELFCAMPGMISKQRAATLLRRGLISSLSDVNVASLIIAGMRLDEEGRTGALPKLTAEAFLADPINLVADETIGIAIANYIGGTLGVHNFLYYDRMKPGISKQLSPFMDDTICGLVAGVMSKVLREES